MPRALLLVAFVLGPAALAQPVLPTGVWTGSLQWRDADPIVLGGTVEECAEGLKILLSSDDGAYRAETVLALTSAGGSPSFAFGMANERRGYALACTAERQADGSFAGRCRTDGDVWARLQLTPPAQSVIGCSE